MRIETEHPESALQAHSELANIIYLFFKFTNYLGFSPFRFVRSTKSGTKFYEKKIWRPQQVACALLHVLAIFRAIADIRGACDIDQTKHKNNPMIYVAYIQGFLYICHHVVTFKGLWFNSRDYLNVVNVIAGSRNLPIRAVWVTKPTTFFIVFGFFALKTILFLLAGGTFVGPTSNWTPSNWLRGLLQQSDYVLRFSQQSSLSNASELHQIGKWDIILAVLTLLASYMSFILLQFTALCMFSFSLTLWIAAKAFDEDITSEFCNHANPAESSKNQIGNTVLMRREFSNTFADGKLEYSQSNKACERWSQIYDNFMSLLQLSETINLVIGIQVLLIVSTSLLHYAVYMDKRLTSQDLLDVIDVLIYFSFYLCSLCMSADIPNRIQAAELWLTRNKNIKSVPMDEANLILHMINKNGIAIHGKSAFTITFSFLGGYFSLMATFFILCIQYA